MLKIINNLKPFIEDNYREINVREYARISNISPPTASKLLNNYKEENLLNKKEDKGYILYSANRESNMFIDLARIYWKKELKNIIEELENKLFNPVIILFGSLTKAEATKDSDIDLAIFTKSKEEVKIKETKREVQLFIFKNREAVKNKELLNNILNGYKLSGEWE